jgi:hypothetical protein
MPSEKVKEEEEAIIFKTNNKRSATFSKLIM